LKQSNQATQANARQRLGDAYAAHSTFLATRGQSQRALVALQRAWALRQEV
jgi:hypothetical protein